MNNSPDAMLDVYVPGAWRCPKCQFALQKATMFVQSGTIGSTREDVMNLTGEVCPNDGEPMLRETWHQRSEDNYKWGVGLMEEIIALVGAESLPAAIEKIKALRADALAPPEPLAILRQRVADARSQFDYKDETEIRGRIARLCPWLSAHSIERMIDAFCDEIETALPAPPRADALEAPADQERP